jgi:signal transduction histidine kinase
LVGGVMAAIARRHVSLQQQSKQAIHRHQRLQDLYGQVMSSMQEGMVILDESLHAQGANPAARAMINSDSDIDGKTVAELFPDQEKLHAYFHETHEKVYQCEWSSRGKVYLLTTTRLPEGDKLAAWLVTLVDISELRDLEQKLVRQEKMAALGQMAAMLAHEIRNPIQILSQAVDLAAVADGARREDMRRIITEEMQRLNRLVSGMLDYARPLVPAPERNPMPELISTSINHVDIDNHHQITMKCEADYLMLDSGHFRLVLDNLLRNALVASPTPGSVGVSLTGEADEGWRLAVSDQGGGIPDAVSSTLFEPFATGRSDGVGLGLATVSQVCQANGWLIDVSREDQTTYFQVSGK